MHDSPGPALAAAYRILAERLHGPLEAFALELQNKRSDPKSTINRLAHRLATMGNAIHWSNDTEPEIWNEWWITYTATLQLRAALWGDRAHRDRPQFWQDRLAAFHAIVGEPPA